MESIDYFKVAIADSVRVGSFPILDVKLTSSPLLNKHWTSSIFPLSESEKRTYRDENNDYIKSFVR